MLTGLLRRARRAARGQDGFSLTEMLVAMTLAVIIGAITMTMFLNIDNSTAATTDRAVGADQARTVLTAWTGYLQVSDGPTAAGSASHRFEWITATSMLFYADLGNRQGTAAATPPTMVWVRLDTTGQLVEEQFDPSGSSYPASYPANYSVCRILANDVTSLTLSPYVSGSGSGSDFGTALAANGAGCVALSGSVSQTDPSANSDLAAVSSVGIDFTVTDSTRTHTEEYSSTVTLPVLGGAA